LFSRQDQEGPGVVSNKLIVLKKGPPQQTPYSSQARRRLIEHNRHKPAFPNLSELRPARIHSLNYVYKSIIYLFEVSFSKPRRWPQSPSTRRELR
jgi:hypothetical protein